MRFLSLGVMFLRFAYAVVTAVCVFLFLLSSVTLSQFLIYGHLGHFQIWASVDKIAMDILVNICLLFS